jgi:hypothetical protein
MLPIAMRSILQVESMAMEMERDGDGERDTSSII